MAHHNENQIGFWIVIEIGKYVSLLLLPILLLISIQQVFFYEIEISKGIDSVNEQASSSLHNLNRPSIPVLKSSVETDENKPDKSRLQNDLDSSTTTLSPSADESNSRTDDDTPEHLPIPLPEQTEIGPETEPMSQLQAPLSERNNGLKQKDTEIPVTLLNGHEDYVNADISNSDQIFQNPDGILRIRKRRRKRSIQTPVTQDDGQKRARRFYSRAGAEIDYKIGAYNHDISANIDDTKVFHFYDQNLNPGGVIPDFKK